MTATATAPLSSSPPGLFDGQTRIVACIADRISTARFAPGTPYTTQLDLDFEGANPHVIRLK